MNREQNKKIINDEGEFLLLASCGLFSNDDALIYYVLLIITMTEELISSLRPVGALVKLLR